MAWFLYDRVPRDESVQFSSVQFITKESAAFSLQRLKILTSIPYQGKLCRGKMTKIFPDKFLSPMKNLLLHIQVFRAKVTKLPLRRLIVFQCTSFSSKETQTLSSLTGPKQPLQEGKT